MSSTRNKRKRPENDPAAAAMAPVSRRRSRDQRAVLEDPMSTAAPDAKNEEPDEPNKPKVSEDADSGESATFFTSTASPTTRATQASSQSPKPDAKSRINPSDGKSQSTTKNREPADTTTDQPDKNDSKLATVPLSTADPGSGSSQPESSTTKQALHVCREPTATNVAGNDSGQGPPASDRESRIRGLITHRSLLLERIQLTRSAAAKRLEDTQVPPGDKASGARKEITDDEEIAAHREMIKQATQAAKKSRSEGDGPGEKRTSLSLRRGSSVGKRMNAALSSLAPGSNAAGSTDGPSAQPMQSTSMPPGKTPAKAPPGAVGISKAAPTQLVSTGQPMIPGGRMHPPNIPPGKMMKASSFQISQKQPTLSGPEIAQKSRVPNPKSFKAASNVNARPNSVSRADPVSMPQHFGAGASALPPNRLVQPKSNFPEAVALREKRDMIQSRLKALLERQQIRELARSDEELRRTSMPSNKKKPFSPQRGLEVRPPAQLPSRRKTQWDCLLQEMSWMATDFIEERKWKISSARTIASAVPTPGFSFAAANASRKIERNRDADTKPVSSGDSKDSKMADTPEISKKKSSGETKQVDDREYAKPTMEDVKAARKVGRVISCMISELGSASRDGGSMGTTDSFHTDALDRYRKIRSTILDEVTQKDASTDEISLLANGEGGIKADDVDKMDVDEPVAGATDETSQDASFESMTKCIESLHRINGKSKSKSTGKEMNNALVTEKLNLSDEQKETIDFVEKLWSGKPSVGSVVVGPAASGKTIATCSLLWKQKSRGPQLLICPPTSVVSASCRQELLQAHSPFLILFYISDPLEV
jgi:hypothetical protein